MQRGHQLIHLSDWLSRSSFPADLTIRQYMDLALAETQRKWPRSRVTGSLVDRRPGHDPFPFVEKHYGVIEIDRWLRIVKTVRDPETEIALQEILPRVQVGRVLGDPWYECVANVLLPGGNVDIDPAARGSLDVPPMQV